MVDQASSLRKIVRDKTEMEQRQGPVVNDVAGARSRVIAVTSGKGGVGKTNIVGNLAVSMAGMGKKVLIMDADLGLANLDIIFGLHPRYNIGDVLSGERELSEIIVEGPSGVRIIPAGSGFVNLTRLTDGTSNRHVLPDFLTREAGLNSGFMLTQYTAAALASENKALVHPASADTIPTSANWEDHVSNGPIAARQARRIIQNVERILAIELLAAAQGIDFRREAMPEARMGLGTQIAYDMIRARVPFLARDDVMYRHMNEIHRLVASGELTRQMANKLDGFRCC